jgi:hypothetical protein
MTLLDLPFIVYYIFLYFINKTITASSLLVTYTDRTDSAVRGCPLWTVELFKYRSRVGIIVVEGNRRQLCITPVCRVVYELCLAARNEANSVEVGRRN